MTLKPINKISEEEATAQAGQYNSSAEFDQSVALSVSEISQVEQYLTDQYLKNIIPPNETMGIGTLTQKILKTINLPQDTPQQLQKKVSYEQYIADRLRESKFYDGIGGLTRLPNGGNGKITDHYDKMMGVTPKGRPNSDTNKTAGRGKQSSLDIGKIAAESGMSPNVLTKILNGQTNFASRHAAQVLQKRQGYENQLSETLNNLLHNTANLSDQLSNQLLNIILTSLSEQYIQTAGNTVSRVNQAIEALNKFNEAMVNQLISTRNLSTKLTIEGQDKISENLIDTLNKSVEKIGRDRADELFKSAASGGINQGGEGNQNSPIPFKPLQINEEAPDKRPEGAENYADTVKDKPKSDKTNGEAGSESVSPSKGGINNDTARNKTNKGQNRPTQQFQQNQNQNQKNLAQNEDDQTSSQTDSEGNQNSQSSSSSNATENINQNEAESNGESQASNKNSKSDLGKNILDLAVSALPFGRLFKHWKIVVAIVTVIVVFLVSTGPAMGLGVTRIIYCEEPVKSNIAIVGTRTAFDLATGNVIPDQVWRDCAEDCADEEATGTLSGGGSNTGSGYNKIACLATGKDLIPEPELRAVMRAISYTEGAEDYEGYFRINSVPGANAAGRAKLARYMEEGKKEGIHPGYRYSDIGSTTGSNSDATGRYQYLSTSYVPDVIIYNLDNPRNQIPIAKGQAGKTWSFAGQTYKYYDFTPRSQDLVMAHYLKTVDVVNIVKTQGVDAIVNARILCKWTSFPGCIEANSRTPEFIDVLKKLYEEEKAGKCGTSVSYLKKEQGGDNPEVDNNSKTFNFVATSNLINNVSNTLSNAINGSITTQAQANTQAAKYTPGTVKEITITENGRTVSGFLVVPKDWKPATAEITILNHDGYKGDPSGTDFYESNKDFAQDLATKGGNPVFLINFEANKPIPVRHLLVGDVQDNLSAMNVLPKELGVTGETAFTLVGTSRGATTAAITASKRPDVVNLSMAYPVPKFSEWGGRTDPVYSQYNAQGAGNLEDLRFPNKNIQITILTGAKDLVLVSGDKDFIRHTEDIGTAYSSRYPNVTVRIIPNANHGFMRTKQALTTTEQSAKDTLYQKITGRTGATLSNVGVDSDDCTKPCTNSNSSNNLANINVSCGAKAFLKAIQAKESGGNYRVRFPSTNYEGDRHPGIIGCGQTTDGRKCSDASGANQMISTTLIAWWLQIGGVNGELTPDLQAKAKKVKDDCNASPFGSACIGSAGGQNGEQLNGKELPADAPLKQILDKIPYDEVSQDTIASKFIETNIGVALKAAGTDRAKLDPIFCSATAQEWASTPCGSQKLISMQAFTDLYLDEYKKLDCAKGPGEAKKTTNVLNGNAFNLFAGITTILQNGIDVNAADEVAAPKPKRKRKCRAITFAGSLSAGDKFVTAGKYTSVMCNDLPCPNFNRGRAHKGVDIAGNANDPILAFEEGVVDSIVFDEEGFGNYVILKHPKAGIYTLYGHMSEPTKLKLGQNVKKGDLVGLQGSTGAVSTGIHLHFEVKKISTAGYFSTRPEEPCNYIKCPAFGAEFEIPENLKKLYQ